MPASSLRDDYPAAAMRHFCDGLALQAAGRRENALCHYAFSAETANKALLQWTGTPTQAPGHLDALAWAEAQRRVRAYAALDGRMLGALPEGSTPPKLFADHPSRRYFRAFSVTEGELDACREYARQLSDSVASLVIDGEIKL